MKKFTNTSLTLPVSAPVWSPCRTGFVLEVIFISDNMNNDNTYGQLCHLETRDVILIKNAAILVLQNRGYNPNALIPRRIKVNNHDSDNSNLHLFQSIYDEDWNYLFNGKYDLEKKYYVYYHTNPFKEDLIFGNGKTGLVFKCTPFYIGKGCGDRCFTTKRYLSHSRYLNRVINMGTDIQTVSNILFDNLNEKEALILESKLITFLGTKNEIFENEKWLHGRHGGYLINTIIPARPEKYNSMFGF
jgi:hypothetical protein